MILEIYSKSNDFYHLLKNIIPNRKTYNRRLKVLIKRICEIIILSKWKYYFFCNFAKEWQLIDISTKSLYYNQPQSIA